MSKKRYQSFVTLALLLTIGLSPVFTFAKSENGNKGKSGEKQELRLAKKEEKKERKEEKKEEKREERQEKQERKLVEAQIQKELRNDRDDDEDDDNDDDHKESKGKAYGHIIAPGYIKNWGYIDFSKYVFIPLGIWQKLIGTTTGTSTIPTKDTTAPVISNLASQVGTTTASITWKTNERADGVVYLSTTTPVLMGTSTGSHSYLSRYHEINLDNLSASTTYYAVVTSKDKAGNVATSTQFSFVTNGGVVSDTQAPVISNPVSTVGTSTISMAWNTNEPATSKMYYSTVNPLVTTASTTNVVLLGNLVTAHNLTATGLATSTAYYIVVESVDGSGNVGQSAQFTATTTSGL